MTAVCRQPPKETIGMSGRSVFTVGAAAYLIPDLQFAKIEESGPPIFALGHSLPNCSTAPILESASKQKYVTRADIKIGNSGSRTGQIR
jgi:hypothetical protein